MSVDYTAEHSMHGDDPTAEATLFELPTAAPRVSLQDRFVVPPFSVLDRRAGYWQDRRRAWMSLGIRSELGRDDELTYSAALENAFGHEIDKTSVFDPVICELVYRWFTKPGALVLDPFAGGSVRGIVASRLKRQYLGVELRDVQVEANRAQAVGHDPLPWWVRGDARDLDHLLLKDGSDQEDFDLVFSCPPYYDLEKYSDDPRDLSNMTYPKFLEAYSEIIAASIARLKPNRFAAWVISDVRDKKTGTYRGLVRDTESAFEAAGARLYNEAIVMDPVITAAVRAPMTFGAHRKFCRVHQYLLVFVKGDPKEAASWAKESGEVVVG